MLDSLQRVTGGKDKDRDARAHDVAIVKSRLSNGDFHIGDRFMLTNLATPDGRPVTDSVVVRDSLNVSIGAWPAISLQGVLRAELQETMMNYAKRFQREPRLQVTPLTRLSVIGGVGRQGFYAVNPDSPLGDVITSTGMGAGSQAQKITVYRGNDRLMSEKQVAEALRGGLTIDEAGLESGDQVRVAEQKPKNGSMNMQLLLFGVTALSAILALIRASYVD